MFGLSMRYPGMGGNLGLGQIGRCQTHACPRTYGIPGAPTHHAALGVGHNRSLFEKVAKLITIDFRVISAAPAENKTVT